MAVITIPEVLRYQLGSEGTEAFAQVIREIDLAAVRELATKADISDIRTDMEKLRSELGQRITFEISGVREDMLKLEGRINEKIATITDKVANFEIRNNEKISSLSDKIANFEVRNNENMAKSEERNNEKITSLNEKVSSLEGRMNEKFAETRGEFKAIRMEMKLYFLILVFIILFTNPRTLDLIGKLLGFAK
jgi:phage host-nuclease inhibitor protein Gam